jgi:hypothetical protein
MHASKEMDSVIIGSGINRNDEAAMAYALLIVEPVGQRQTRTEAEGRALYDRMVRFSEDLKSRGLLTMTQSLKTDTRGARVRVQGNQSTVVDGPFAEAKEMIGGFFILTCETRAQAIALAEECPAARWATVEVRELGPCFT